MIERENASFIIGEKKGRRTSRRRRRRRENRACLESSTIMEFIFFKVSKRNVEKQV